LEPPKRKRGRPRKRLLIPGEQRGQVEAGGKPKPPPPQVPKPPPPPPPAKAKANGKDALQKRVEQIINFIQTECLVPEGRLMGERIILEDWQKKAIWAIYGNEAGTRRAIISIPRKAGKTTFAACLLLTHLVGLGQENSQLYSAAQSRDQAALIFNAACKIINQNVDLRALIKITESSKTLLNIEKNVRYRALSADATTAFGLSPSFVIFDELGQVRGPRSPLFEAARAPPHVDDWVCIASAGCDGQSVRVRGAFNTTVSYKRFDIVSLDGAAFIARRDSPGVPGISEDGWQLMSRAGSRGPAGEVGPRGKKGERGEPGEDAPTIVSWTLDRKNYCAVPTMSNGTQGAVLELRGLFEQFCDEEAIGAAVDAAVTTALKDAMRTSLLAPL
jgi:hypothetical protein